MNSAEAEVYDGVMLRRILIACVAVLLLATAALAERGIPEPVIPQGFGVNIHFVRPDEAEVEKLAAIGFRFIRMDFTWGATERKQREYDFSGYDALVGSMSKRGIRVLFILDYGNRLYDGGQAPRSQEGRAAFAKWAAAAAKHFAGRGIIWEIWNEPNLAQFWKPAPNVEDYCKLAHATIDAVRAADPQAFVVGPASSGFPWEFLEVMARDGVLAKLDAVSVHPYRQKPPETAKADYHKLRLLLERASPRKRLPIISGEWGYSTGWQNLTEEMQADYLVRQWLFNLANDVNLSIWYDWRDDGLDPKEPEHHFGSVYRDFRLKPAAIQAQELCTYMKGYRYVRRLATGSADDYVLMFSDGHKTRTASWTAAEPKALEMSGGPGASPIHRFNLGSMPVYADVGGSDLARWRPLHAHNLVRAGEVSYLSLAVTAGDWLDKASFRVSVEEQVVSTGDPIVRGEDGTMRLPIRLADAGRPTVYAKIERLLPNGHVPLYETALVALLVSNHVGADVLPTDGKGVPVVVHNAAGEALSLELRAKAASGEGAEMVKLSRGELTKLAVIPMPAEVQGPVKVTGRTGGGAVLNPPPVEWRKLELPAEGWRVSLDGDRKVEASAAVSVADLAEPPVGPKRGLKIEYRFAEGWRFAAVRPPEAICPIERRPRVVGMWVLGDESRDVLRLRFSDRSGQTFQVDHGVIDWSGWKWVEMPLDGSSAHSWGGAGDGAVQYPIRWEAMVLLDNGKVRSNGRHVHVAGTSLRY